MKGFIEDIRENPGEAIEGIVGFISLAVIVFTLFVIEG